MSLASRRRGKAGELLAEAWLHRVGHVVTPPRSGDHDRIVDGHKVEIKFSTLWEQGDYVFQQLRNQDYEFVMLLGVSPASAHGWLVPKQVALEHAIPQHGGSRGTDTRWLRFRAGNAPPWMQEFGGELEAFEEAAVRLLG